MTRNPDIVIVGAGIIGCALAWRLARRGCSVTVLESREAPAQEASGAAGGILMYNAAGPQPPQWHALAEGAIAVHSRCAAELGRGRYGGLWSWCGRLEAAYTEQEHVRAQAAYAACRRQVSGTIWYSPEDIADCEPCLAPGACGGYLNPREGWVCAGELTRALAVEAAAHGARFQFGTPVQELQLETGRVVGAITAAGRVQAQTVILTAGAYSSRLDPLRREGVFPVRGQALRLYTGTPIPIRHVIYGRGIYLVPRPDGVMVGATVEEVGFTRGITAGGVRALLDGALSLLPSLANCAWENTRVWSGFRPQSRWRIPILGSDPALPGLWWATGHYADGILLAPLTAELIETALLDERHDALLTAQYLLETRYDR